MAIGSHGRGRGGTVGDGRLAVGRQRGKAFFVFGRVCPSCCYNRPRSIRYGPRSVGLGPACGVWVLTFFGNRVVLAYLDTRRQSKCQLFNYQ